MCPGKHLQDSRLPAQALLCPRARPAPAAPVPGSVFCDLSEFASNSQDSHLPAPAPGPAPCCPCPWVCVLRISVFACPGPALPCPPAPGPAPLPPSLPLLPLSLGLCFAI